MHIHIHICTNCAPHSRYAPWELDCSLPKGKTEVDAVNSGPAALMDASYIGVNMRLSFQVRLNIYYIYIYIYYRIFPPIFEDQLNSEHVLISCAVALDRTSTTICDSRSRCGLKWLLTYRLF